MLPVKEKTPSLAKNIARLVLIAARTEAEVSERAEIYSAQGAHH